MRIGSSMNTYTRNQNMIHQQKQTERKQIQLSKKLSTGKKVNSAADDAAVLAISEKMMKQAKSLNKGASNINAGIHVANIADGAMSSISENLMDIEANSIRAMNGTMSDSDKAIIQENIKGSIETVNHIARNAKYNELNLLDGSSDHISIATGSGGMSVSGGNMTGDALGLSNYSVTGDTIDKSVLDSALHAVNSARSKQGAQSNALSSAYRSNKITEENTTASYSRMVDTDMAKAISAYKSTSVFRDVQLRMQNKQMQNNNLMINLLA